MYDNGYGVEQDLSRAARLYKAAATGDHADALANLGLLYYRGTGVPQDFGRALELYRRAAEKGHARAQNNLGLMYTRGEGTPQDYVEAAKWFEEAAGQGLAVAVTNLSVMYANGFGVDLDEEKAAELSRQGGRLGDPTSLLPDEEIPFLFDDRLAQPSPDPETIATIVQGAEAGDPVSEFLAGYAYATGTGIDADEQLAAHWFRRAAEKGVTSAMTNLGLMYFRGRGVPQDYVTGYMWLNLASAGSAAAEIRDKLAMRMTAEQVNQAQKLAADRLDLKRAN